ncbi:MAG: GTP 3',8-cyclase MoaA [Anaerovoracaceae bacterium]|nr:GTP 3',8-cyclase MoaA [Anaerovoracaceae bacterium]
MIDGTGRNIDYIRISITDRCNLRCVYCMPETGVQMTSHKEILTFDEIIRLCGIFASLGIKKIKLTGGEPLCRIGVDDLVRDLKAVQGVEQVTLTTNAVELDEHLLPLYEAGLDAINISIDTADPALYKRLTRRDKFDEVMANIKMAAEFGKIPLKINCVPMTAEQKLYDVAEFARNYNIHVRFIEMMPIGFGKEFSFISRDAIIELLEERFGPLTAADVSLGNGPAEYYSIPGFKGKIGFISAVSHKFCQTCNRVRMTAEGYLKTCLQYDSGVDLKACLRAGGTDAELKELIANAINEKPLAHHFGDEGDGGSETKIMSQIGG